MIKIKVGREEREGRFYVDRTRVVAFEGRLIGEIRRWENGDRWVDVSLYETEDGLILHLQYRLGPEERYSVIERISPSDLQPGSPWEDLGWKTGLATPLTVEEGLQYSREVKREEGV